MTSAGALDTSFYAGAISDGFINTLAIQGDGRLLAGGTFTMVGGTTRHIIRLNTDGSLDAGFNPGLDANDYVSSIAIEASGQILVVGAFTQFDIYSINRIVRLNVDGSVDNSINFGTGADNFISTVALQNLDGTIYVGGAFTQFNGAPHSAIAKLFDGTNTGTGIFTFAEPVFNASEAAGSVPVTVVRSGGLTGTASVKYTMTDGTASVNDYTNVSGTLVFSDGQGVQTINIGLIDNHVVDGTRNFQVALSSPGKGSSLGAITSATVNILDNDSVIGFSASDYTANQTDGQAQITLSRIGGLIDSVTVDFITLTNIGTAVAGTDYTPVTQTVVFGPGVAVQTVNVPVLDDQLPELTQTLGLALSNATASATLGVSSATLHIVNNHPAPGVLSFSSPT